MSGARYRTGGRFEQIAGYARAAREGNLIVVSATAALSAEGEALFVGDAHAQTKHAFEQALVGVVELGGSLDEVVRTRLLLAPGVDWHGPVNAHREVFAGIDPANSTYYTGGLLPADALVEVEVEAIASRELPSEAVRKHEVGETPARGGSAHPSEPDVTVKRVEDLEHFYHGSFARLRAGLGVSAFGIQLITLPPGSDIYPEHDHRNNGQEEVYVALTGRGTLTVGSQEYTLEPGVFIRVGPRETRKVITEDEPAEFIVVGAVPGLAYSPPPYTNLGAALAVLSASPLSVAIGEEVTFDGSDSTCGDGTGEIGFAWDFDGNGSFVPGGGMVVHSYNAPGIYYAVLRITDNAGQTDSDKIRIDVRGLPA